MGAGLKKVAGVGRGVVDPFGITGSNPIANALGLGGQQEDYFQAANGNQPLADLNARGAIFGQGGVNDALTRYAGGEGSLADALNSSHLQGVQADEFKNALATGATTGSRYATDEVMNNPMLSGLFGKGGALERAGNEEKDLASRGYALQPEDHEAYGQASGDIARLFGQQENSLAQSLADRGLAQGTSGAAQVAFSGLAGNKNEMLAKAQTDIADKRMKNNMDRLTATRSFMTNLGAQGEKAIQDQFGRQLAGAGRTDDNLARNAQLVTGQNSAANEANLASMKDKRGAKGKTLLEGLGNGIYSVGEAAPSMAVSKMSGGGMAPTRSRNITEEKA